MAIEFIEKGDIWVDFDAGLSVAHGCNKQAVMGGGVALQVKEKFPKLYAGYAHACLSGVLKLGDVYPYWVDHEPPKLVYNLITQWDTNGASYDGIWRSVNKLSELMVKFETPAVSVPQLGAGLGGLNWNVVKTMLQEIFVPAKSCVLFVYEGYEKGIGVSTESPY